MFYEHSHLSWFTRATVVVLSLPLILFVVILGPSDDFFGDLKRYITHGVLPPRASN
jgi:hypothetical protein